MPPDAAPLSTAHPQLAASLAGLGIDAHNYRVLKLLPLVYVAWADGKIEHCERERIVSLAQHRFFIGATGTALLEAWMEKRPESEYFKHGLDELFLMAQEESHPLVHAEELHELLLHSEWIARATADALDSPTAVTAEEEEALAEIARALGVDNGMSWARMLDELGAGPASIRPERRPKSG